MRDTPAPQIAGHRILIQAARNEYEPLQIVTRSTLEGNRSISLGPSWSGPSGSVISATLHDVAYGASACAVGEPDRLDPITFGSALPVCTGNNQAFWLTFFVPTNALSGLYSNSLTCVLPGISTNIPILLQVFNFTLPAEIAFGSFVSFSFPFAAQDSLAMKRWFYQHRLTPRNVTWPSAMSYNITWDSSANPSACAAFFDEPNEPPIYSIRWLAHQFVAGEDFNNGVGFPNFFAQPLVGVAPRPTSFCGQSISGDPRGEEYGSAAYNAAWGAFLKGLQDYCDPSTRAANPFGHDYLSKALYWVMNEPHTTDHYNLAAWLASLSRQYAPKLRLLISEEAKPEIYENPLYPGHGFDVWLAHVPSYSCAIGNSLLRRRHHGEQSWWYTLPQDPPNFFAANQTNRSALETRILTWLAWSHRVEGWTDSGLEPPIARFLTETSIVPSLRSELLREAFEDYEYFKLANFGEKPLPLQANPADQFVGLIAASLTGFDRDPSRLHWLRTELGRRISGEPASVPILPVTSPRPFGSYYLNFQNPAASPTNEPLVVNGRTWTKVGWELYDPATNTLGWRVPSTVSLAYGWSANLSANELQRSYIYDDYALQTTFTFLLPNGVYDVEVGMGMPARVSQALVRVNGTNFFGNRSLNQPQTITNNVSATNRLAVVNGTLVMEIGQQINGDYNFLNYLAVTGVSPSSPDNLDDLWQARYFNSATNALSSPGADPDLDGAGNFLEFHFGTDPVSAGSSPVFTCSLPTADLIELRWTSAPDHVFRIDHSGNLVTWAPIINQILATNSTVVITIPHAPASPQGFYRIAPVAP
jgi:hypothetical protein